MATDKKQFWHKPNESDNGETTLRHTGPHYRAIREWAEKNDLTEIFDAIALAFGFTENFTIVGNLYREFSNPDAAIILRQWGDNPYIHHLKRFLQTFGQDQPFSETYPGIPQGISRGNTKTVLRAAGADLQNEHFLLEMLVQPPAASKNDHFDLLRRTLRIWLIVQALVRVAEHDCVHDTQIQQIASALCLPSENEKWELIDEVLQSALRACPSITFSYAQFSLAIRHATSRLIPRFKGHSRKALLILTAFQAVAEGHCNPTNIRRSIADHHLLFKNLSQLSTDSFDLSNSSEEPQVLAVADGQDPADEESLEQLVLFDVIPGETPEEQKLSRRSVLMQTAELSNFLPWSWDKLLPPEINLLEEWIQRTLADPKMTERLGAAFVWLSIHLGRSLDFIQEIAISDTTGDEWSLSTDFLTVHRKAPRRHNAWQPDPKSVALIEQFKTDLCVDLPAEISAILGEARHRHTQISNLRQLWTYAGPQALATWFHQHAKRHFPRLTSAKLANAHSQQVFNEFGDHSFARLLSAHPRAALPAACGYANWSIAQVRSGFQLPLRSEHNNDDRVNLLGSLLSPIESILVERVQRATTVLKDSSQGSPILFHNYLAQYTVTALYAATGCRYLSDPFESLSHFCDEPPVVFINDKSDDRLHSGRIVPVPNDVARLLSRYCEHLKHLKVSFAARGHALAHRIDAVLTGNSESLPLFFLLDDYGAWHPMNDENVPGGELFDWPLPRNLFRHRFAQQLAREGVNAEVIDGWLGHGERGTSSYGDFSARCWRDDYEQYKHVLNDCFGRLGFVVDIPEPDYSVPSLNAEHNDDSYREPTSFGQARRHEERRRVREQAQLEARRELELAVAVSHNDETDNGKPGLGQSDVNRLVKQMISRENGMPHPRAAVRMEVLVQWLEERNPETRQLIRHRVMSAGVERSLVRDTCPKSLEALPYLRKWAEDIKCGISKTRPSKSDGLALATAFLAIEKRISYPGLLEDVIQGKNYRVIQHEQLVYLEYSESLEPENYDQPVQRHQIDHSTGRLLAKGLGIKDTKELESAKCPKSLQSLVNILSATGHLRSADRKKETLGLVLRALYRLIEQANLVDLPGLLAGALSERHPPTSLCLYDYFRLTTGHRYEQNTAEQALDIPDNAGLTGIPVSATGTYPSEFYEAAKAFFKGLQDILNRYTKSQSRDIARQVEQHCRAHSHSVSSAVLLVGYWVAHQIRKGKGRSNSTHKPYASNSIKRYLTALSGAFRGFAFKADLILMDEDEVTELCAKMLSHQAENSRDLAYFSARLLDFFTWASKRGVSSPDWDELDLGSSRRSVRPRLFSESEYLNALHSLLNADIDNIERGTQSAFVLLLAYRFGLRAQEAIGLLRSDWCESGGMIWVLVQSNAIRGLKSSVHSRRAVPLLFQLSDVERSLVSTILTRYTTRLGNVENKPILADREGRLTPFAGLIPADAARALKRATGNPLMTLHQARHGFCNILSSALFEIQTPLARKLTDSIDCESIRRVLLGNRCHLTRRSAMAIARALGHQSPRTQLRSYSRLLTEWADELTPMESRYKNTLRGAIKIDKWPVRPLVEPHGETENIFAQQANLTPLTVIEAFRLMSLGYAVSTIESMLRLSSGELSDVEVLVDRINAGIRFKAFDLEQSKKAYVYGRKLPKYLLKSRPSNTWPRLLELCENLATHHESGDYSLPSLDQASNLIGRNGHLLMNSAEDARLIRLLVDVLRIPNHEYDVVIKSRPDSSFRAQAIIEAGRFQPSKKAIQLDTFNDDHNEKYPRYRSYAGLVLNSSVGVQIHDRLELVILFMAVASAHCPRPDPLSTYI